MSLEKAETKNLVKAWTGVSLKALYREAPDRQKNYLFSDTYFRTPDRFSKLWEWSKEQYYGGTPIITRKEVNQKTSIICQDIKILRFLYRFSAIHIPQLVNPLAGSLGKKPFFGRSLLI